MGNAQSVSIDLSTVGDSGRSVSSWVEAPAGARSFDVWIACGNAGLSGSATVLIEAAPPTANGQTVGDFIQFWTNPLEIEKGPSGASTIVQKSWRVLPGMRLRGRTTVAGTGGAVDSDAALVFVFSDADAANT
jgi:hypothetical protein